MIRNKGFMKEPSNQGREIEKGKNLHSTWVVILPGTSDDVKTRFKVLWRWRSPPICSFHHVAGTN